MPGNNTQDIVLDWGATGDGRTAYRNWSIDAGSNQLHLDQPIIISLNDKINVRSAGPTSTDADGNSGPGLLQSWVAAIAPDGLTLTLGDAAQNAASGAPIRLDWCSNDDGPAFRAYNDWVLAHQDQYDSFTLTLGPDDRTFVFGLTQEAGGEMGNPYRGRNNHPFFMCLKPWHVRGNGPAHTRFLGMGWAPQPGAYNSTSGFNLGAGGGGIINYNGYRGYAARVRTVRRGDRRLICKVPGHARQFVPVPFPQMIRADDGLYRSLGPGTWAILTALDLQGAASFPPNHYLDEYVQIDHIDLGAGIIYLVDPISENDIYKDTWPEALPRFRGLYSPPPFTDTSPGDLGGPATLYALTEGWNCDGTWEGFTVDVDNQTTMGGRKITVRNLVTTGPIPPDRGDYNISPSALRECYWDNIDTSQQGAHEVDKWISYWEITNSRLGTVLIQNSDHHLVVRNCTWGRFQGTFRFSEFYDSQLRGITVGPSGYGTIESTVIINCDLSEGFSAFNSFNVDIGQGAGIEQLWSFSDGLFTIPYDVSWNYAFALRLLVPPAWCFFGSLSGGALVGTTTPMFQVLDSWNDDDNIYVKTSWKAPNTGIGLGGGYPDWPPGAQRGLAYTIVAFSCPHLVFINNTYSGPNPVMGHEIDRLNAAARAGFKGWPYGCYYEATIQGAVAPAWVGGWGNNYTTPWIGGWLRKIEIEVERAADGMGAMWGTPYGNTPAFDHNAGYLPGYNNAVNWVIDARTLGTRVIMPGGSTALAGDAVATLQVPDPAGTWIGPQNAILQPIGSMEQIAGGGAQGPLIHYTVITDPGIPVTDSCGFIINPTDGQRLELDGNIYQFDAALPGWRIVDTVGGGGGGALENLPSGPGIFGLTEDGDWINVVPIGGGPIQGGIDVQGALTARSAAITGIPLVINPPTPGVPNDYIALQLAGSDRWRLDLFNNAQSFILKRYGPSGDFIENAIELNPSSMTLRGPGNSGNIQAAFGQVTVYNPTWTGRLIIAGSAGTAVSLDAGSAFTMQFGNTAFLTTYPGNLSVETAFDPATQFPVGLSRRTVATLSYVDRLGMVDGAGNATFPNNATVNSVLTANAGLVVNNGQIFANAGIQGVVNGSDAATGSVGQYVEGYQSGTVQSGVETYQVSPLSIPPGDWDIEATAEVGVQLTGASFALTSIPFGLSGDIRGWSMTGNEAGAILVSPRVRGNFTVATQLTFTVNLVGAAVPSGNNTFGLTVTARRMR